MGNDAESTFLELEVGREKLDPLNIEVKRVMLFLVIDGDVDIARSQPRNCMSSDMRVVRLGAQVKSAHDLVEAGLQDIGWFIREGRFAPVSLFECDV